MMISSVVIELFYVYSQTRLTELLELAVSIVPNAPQMIMTTLI
jgi:hypothetical protein